MKPIILVILDGWGISDKQMGNAIAQAQTPTIDEIEKLYPAISLQASGIAVGLPWNEAGSSEVGHLVLGAGRVIYQYLPRIVLAIKDGSFFKNPALVKAIEHAKTNNSCLHLMGLVSSGNIHSYVDHLYGLIELARRENIEKVHLHVFTDGIDAPPKEAAHFLQNVEEKLNKLKNGKIATVIGRYYAMDRNKNWNRTQRAYECLVESRGLKCENTTKAIKSFYERGIIDAFIEPVVIVDKETQNPLGAIQDNDSIIFFNFRKDKARQLTKAFVLSDFKEFPRKPLKNICFVTMTQYEEGLPVRIAFPPIEIKNHLTEVLSKANKKVLKIAETEKYAHVTYFFNGGKEMVYPGEEQVLIPSTSIVKFDKCPEMAALDITDRIIKEVGRYDLTVVNYANTDMVAHTGNFQATIKAVETLDNCLKSLLKLVREKKYYLLITADHGNAEEMINPLTGELNPEHTTNPVPCYLITPENKREKSKSELENLYRQPRGLLADIAPTVLEMMKIPKPEEMTGQSLLEILE
ncbi:MAG: 2,3-bisphosphoglycerate-independent phosphoglycerate mutase [Candidatus Omnitrophica bacterium]|nr:2,3-bisphosphoglycerate-independent phosphoglycerate mutase [Candidatus Omnitrophota bacterium]